MIVINAHINQRADFSVTEILKLNKAMQTRKIEKFIDVSTVPDLLTALETHRGHPVLLFTNFTPNHFFERKGINVDEFKIDAMLNWFVPEYSFSAALYHQICKEYSIFSVHILTSAPRTIVNDIDLLEVTDGVQTIINRKQDWWSRDRAYEIFFRAYMLEHATDAVKVISDKK